MDTIFKAILIVIVLLPAFVVVGWYGWSLIRKFFCFLYRDKSVDFIILELLNFLVPNIAFTALVIFLTGAKLVLAEMSTLERSKYLVIFLLAYFLMVFIARVSEMSDRKDNER